ncbi:uncharacterized protein LOC131666771 [Phymastichus coffea]|uniref:uncharacterized protein LOC131666771 n=1 Tax=Phymastichus coffea TaxID=108790 RepID=UPI00273C7A18|nr:uncharacterized protein LOC131666771 [Phymastichus coffea]
MYNTGRRSAISTSELGLYSDHSDPYNNNTYSTNVRKLVIGIMVIFSVILIGIFLYDFTLSASVNSKMSQETKHIYILQNSFRKPTLNATRRSSVTLAPTIYIVNSSHATGFEDRSDDEKNTEYKQEEVDNPVIETRTQREAQEGPESKMQNLQNFKFRDRMLDRTPDEIELSDRPKSIIQNHAMIYRASNKIKLPTLENDEAELSPGYSQRATPFRFELTGPPPASFKRPKYPQLSQYQHPHTSRNIQDIIKYLTNNPESLNRGIKFTGYYVNPKKYNTDIREVAMNSEKSEEAVPYAMSFNTDPLYQYKPKHPADVNLLATSNFRFSPMGLQRYNSYYDSYHQKPTSSKHSIYQEHQYDNAGNYGTMTYSKKRKPKPFSVMLDIYPITEATEPTKKSSSKSQTIIEDADSRRSPIPLIPYQPRHSKAYGVYTQAPPMPPIPNSQIPAIEEKEAHHMILHLNVYPRKKTKATWNDVMERSEAMLSSEKQELIDRLITPFNKIAKHLTAQAAVEEAKYDEEIDRTDSVKVRYEENPLIKEDVEEVKGSFAVDHSKVQVNAERLIAAIDGDKCQNCEIITTQVGSTTSLGSTTVSASTISGTIANTTIATTNFSTIETTTVTNIDSTTFKDIDTVEGFQKFADSLIAMD